MKIIRFITLAAGVLSSSILLANQETGGVKIKYLANWVGTTNNPNEILLVKTNEAQLTNPANCPITDVYHLDAASKVSRAMLLTAFTAKTNTSLNIYSGGCSSGNRPLIVKISLIE